MHLLPREQEKLMIVVAADLARTAKGKRIKAESSGIRCIDYI